MEQNWMSCRVVLAFGQTLCDDIPFTMIGRRRFAIVSRAPVSTFRSRFVDALETDNSIMAVLCAQWPRKPWEHFWHQFPKTIVFVSTQKISSEENSLCGVIEWEENVCCRNEALFLVNKTCALNTRNVEHECRLPASENRKKPKYSPNVIRTYRRVASLSWRTTHVVWHRIQTTNT